MWNALFANIKLEEVMENEVAKLCDEIMLLLRILIEEEEKKGEENAKLHGDYNCGFIASSKAVGGYIEI